MTHSNESMPIVIKTDGRSYFRTGLLGKTLSACPFGAGHTSHEYHAEGGDTYRLHAISPTEFWLD